MKSLYCQVLSATLLSLGLHGAVVAKAAAIPAGGTADACSWNRPGANAFTGDVVAAVDRYTDIPVEVRERLKARMAKREYDDMVTIRRDGIAGRAGYEYGKAIRDMHFGAGKLCRTVTRKAWTARTVERGLVYCDSGQCILVPTVCRNVSRITRRGVSDGNVGGGGPGGSSGGGSGSDAPATGGVPGTFSTDSKVGALSVPAGGEPATTVVPPIEFFGPTGAGTGSSSTATAAGGGSSSDALGTPITSGGPGAPFIVGSAPAIIFGSGAGGGDSSGLPSRDSGIPGATGSPGSPGGGTVITPIPEPQTWALMLGGLAALAVAARRRVRR